MAEVLATELGPYTELTGHVQYALLPLEVPEPVTGFAACGGKVVQVVGRGVLGGPQGVLG